MKRVIKVGGSLQKFSKAKESIGDWLDRHAADHNVVIAGGGALVDIIRGLHEIDPIDDAVAHWLCLRAMSQTAAILSLSQQLSTTDDWTKIVALQKPTTLVFDVYRFMRDVEPNLSGTPLPIGWHVTSDSIAARVAQVWDADELVLLKSCLPDPKWGVSWAAREGYVDEWFPTAAKDLRRVRVVNLRDPAAPEAEFQ